MTEQEAMRVWRRVILDLRVMSREDGTELGLLDARRQAWEMLTPEQRDLCRAVMRSRQSARPYAFSEDDRYYTMGRG